MTMQRTTEGRSATDSREGAIRQSDIERQRALFESYPPVKQDEIRDGVRRRLLAEQRKAEFSAQRGGQRRGSELARMAWLVYGVREGDE